MKTEEPLVSICCITFNHEKYIRDCIEGFLMQNTKFPIEIIVHDDASTDGTAKIIKEYADKNSGLFSIILQNENQHSKGGGSIYARFVFPRACGKYIALCEGDDYWTDPYKLQKQVDFLEENPEYGLISSDVNLINDKGEPLPDNNMVLKQREYYKPTINVFDLLKINRINTLTVCVRTNLMQALSERVVKENIWYVYDYWFWLNVALKSKICVSKEKMANYRIHSKGVSRQKGFFDGKSQNIRYEVLTKILNKKLARTRKEKEIVALSGISLIRDKKLSIKLRLKLLFKSFPYYKYLIMGRKIK